MPKLRNNNTIYVEHITQEAKAKLKSSLPLYRLHWRLGHLAVAANEGFPSKYGRSQFLRAKSILDRVPERDRALFLDWARL